MKRVRGQKVKRLNLFSFFYFYLFVSLPLFSMVGAAEADYGYVVDLKYRARNHAHSLASKVYDISMDLQSRKFNLETGLLRKRKIEISVIELKLEEEQNKLEKVEDAIKKETERDKAASEEKSEVNVENARLSKLEDERDKVTNNIEQLRENEDETLSYYANAMRWPADAFSKRCTDFEVEIVDFTERSRDTEIPDNCMCSKEELESRQSSLKIYFSEERAKILKKLDDQSAMFQDFSSQLEEIMGEHREYVEYKRGVALELGSSHQETKDRMNQAKKGDVPTNSSTQVIQGAEDRLKQVKEEDGVGQNPKIGW